LASDPAILLIDTDVASNLQIGKLRPDYTQIVNSYDILAITWITEAEWRIGLLLRENPKRQERFERWMGKVLRLSQDDEVTRRYAELTAIAHQHGGTTKKRQNDTWIAASAVRHDLPLMTLNRGDFMVYARHGGLRLEPPPD
jgi:predicted nucleic acid-binding protein